MFKTYTISADGANSMYDLHRIVHKAFHTPTQKLACPRFRPHMEGMLRVRSETPPVNGNVEVIAEQVEDIPVGEVKLLFRFAEAYKHSGKTLVFNSRHNKHVEDRQQIETHIAELLAGRQIDVKHVKYKRTGVVTVHDRRHSYKLPFGEVIAVVDVHDKGILEKLMLDGIGLDKYLGFGYVDAVKIIPDED